MADNYRIKRMTREAHQNTAKQMSRLSDREVKAQAEHAKEGSAIRDLAQEVLGRRQEAAKEDRYNRGRR